MHPAILSFAVIGIAATGFLSSAGLGIRSAAAQVQTRPTEPPLVTAAGEAWFALREPMAVAGDIYYPAGPQVFFDGYRMVRSGHYNGVPIYSDTTLEPFSVFFVPASRGLMQPYERVRDGDLAGTTGSRTPSFPVQLVPYPRSGNVIGMAATAPTALPLTIGAIGAFTPGQDPLAQPAAGGTPSAGTATGGTVAGRTVVAGAGSALSAARFQPVVSVRAPESNVGVWIRFDAARWGSSGPAVPFVDSGFRQVGEHAGLPVYRSIDGPADVIYAPTGEDLVAPYRRLPPAR